MTKTLEERAHEFDQVECDCYPPHNYGCRHQLAAFARAELEGFVKTLPHHRDVFCGRVRMYYTKREEIQQHLAARLGGADDEND